MKLPSVAARALHAVDQAIGRAAGSRRVLIEPRTPMNLVVLEPIWTHLLADVRVTLEFSYEEPTTVRWVQEKGEVKSLEGSWQLEDLGDGRTRATYGLVVDPGRMLGMLLRGPVEATVRDFLLGNAAAGLKQRAEGS